jgi:hypothetical protein
MHGAEEREKIGCVEREEVDCIEHSTDFLHTRTVRKILLGKVL